MKQDVFAKQMQQSQGDSKVSTALLSILIIAIVAVTAGIVVMVVKARKGQKASEGGPSQSVFKSENGHGSPDKSPSKLGEGDLDADGSGTLGSPQKLGHGQEDAEEEGGGVELETEIV